MEAVRASLAATLEAGYDLLHIDCTADPILPPGETLGLHPLVERTLELLEWCEYHRRRLGLPPLCYEVGTEEIQGGLADLTRFRQLLEMLTKGCASRGLRGIWPRLVVAAVGTDLHTTAFDSDVASRVVGIAAEFGCLVKGHYTDNVSNPEAYPQTGMGGANVGPEFTEAEYHALSALAEEEEALIRQGKLRIPSGIVAALREAVVASGRWKKWLQPQERGRPFQELPEERQQWLVRTGCRYIWNKPKVRAARCRLYANHPAGEAKARAYVLDAIAEAVHKYFRAFRLRGTLDSIAARIRSCLS